MTTSSQVPVFCGTCGTHSMVALAALTPQLRCRCGSDDLGLDGVDNTKTAAGGTGWVGPDPRRYDGWNEYPGPTPQVTPRVPPVADTQVCPVCQGTGYDVLDKMPCRECGGTGVITHPTQTPNPQFGETRDPGRPLPEGGAHLTVGSRKKTAVQARDIYAMENGDEIPVGPYSVSYHSEQALGDDGRPARGYTVGTYVVRHPEKETRYYRHSPHGPGLSGAKPYAADQAIDYINNRRSVHDASRTAGRPSTDPYGSVEEHIRSSTPGYSEHGYRTPTEPFNPNDAASFYPKADTRGPHLKNWTPGKEPTGPYVMDQAACPNCGTRPTELRKDKNEDAWWVCNGPNCGPLANIDKHPEINPYAPPADFTPDRSMKTGGFLARNRKTGRLIRMLAVIHEHNELGEREAVTLARESLARYGEGR